MASYVLAGVLAVVAAALAVRSLLRQLAFLVPVVQWLSGYRKDGRPGRPRRAAWRSGGSLATVAAVSGWFASPQVTVRIVGGLAVCCVILALVLCVRLAVLWRHRRQWLRPLHLAAHKIAGVDKRRPPHQWIQVNRARTHATLSLPAGFPAEQKDKDRLAGIATAKLGMHGAEPEWRLAGPKPQLMLLPSPAPPPSLVTLDDIMPAIRAAKSDELVWGRGKRSEIVKNSLSGDSPHWGLSMGSGAGKSWTIRALLAQALYHGAIGLILDPKMISHQWAEGLPNVKIARRVHEIHRTLVWLGGEGGELERRNDVALAGADLDGNVHATVGPRIIVVCEELNTMAKMLRRYWDQVRDREDPKRSPALDSLDVLSFMGRQVLCNVLYVAQRLSVRAGGGDGDARENIGVIAFGRYSPSNWKMLAGDHPMPPKSLKEGRLQVVASEVTEVQCVKMFAREARALATAGTVSLLPSGMPGVPRVPGTAAPELISSAEQAFVPGTGTAPVLPPGRVTLREAVSEGIVSLSLEALRKASQREGFPARQGHRGLAGEWDPAELAEWEATRR